MRYLLDTNVVSALIRIPHGRVVEHIRKVGEAQGCTSIIVAAEAGADHYPMSQWINVLRRD
jgi:tRNA(fMet)-specific endonuclease VapC